ncbi:MAG: DUF2974 domain-containing protein [Ruminococcaceae bacterium]|nr:DUF2974 domain-containing protein [Oscillospiraceae bacterium]
MPLLSRPAKPEKPPETSGTGNLIDYVVNMQQTLLEAPFSLADSMVLAELSYLDFQGMVPPPSLLSIPVRYSIIAARPGALERMVGDTPSAENKLALARALAESPRFAGMTLDYYVNIVDPDMEKQFSAVTIRLADHTAFIAFRGTDNTLTGWKENFNMAFLCPVPAQRECVNYLNNVAGWSRRKLRVGGHSKGGNLALYSSIFCKPEVQSRILQVFTLDSPGFKNMIYDSHRYRALEDRVFSLLPQDSKIGTLLLENERYQVIESGAEGFAQHDLFTWHFDGLEPKLVDKLSEDAIHFDATLDNWLERMDDRRRRLVVDAFFELIDSTDADTFGDVLGYIKSGELTSYKKLMQLEPEVRRELINIFALLGKAYLRVRV